MRTVSAAVAELVDALRVEGHRADIDPGRLATDPGCIWVEPREIRDYTLGGGATLVCWLYLIVANIEPAQAIELLDDALESVLGLVTLSPDDVIDLTAAVPLPGTSATLLPAYRLAVDIDL